MKTVYLEPESLPDAYIYLPSPALPSDDLFAGDKAYHEWGKTLRESERGILAREDANSTLDYILGRFAPALGFSISFESAPSTYTLLSRCMTTSVGATKRAKDIYKRVRPFDEFKETTSVPEMEKAYSGTASYPSGHSTRGWTIALILSELCPDKASEILSIGYQYGESRVIVGYHYESDVQAARTASSAAVAVMHSDKAFRKDMKKAEKEINKIRR